MRPGLLRVTYWALDEAGRRAEQLARVEQDASGRYSPVLCNDPRAIDAVLELADGGAWREVRHRRLEPSDAPRVLGVP